MNGELPAALVFSLTLTAALETGFFLLTGKRNKKDLLLVILVNVLTNPAVVLVYWLALLYTDMNHVLLKAALELFAVLTEGYYFNKYGRGFKRPYLFCVAANAFSFGIGVLLQRLM